MELSEWVIIGVYCTVVCGVFALICGFVVAYFSDRSVRSTLARLESDVASLEGRLNGKEGVNRRAEKQEMMQQAMIEAAAIMKNPEIADKQGAILALATKYPMLALDLLKKGI